MTSQTISLFEAFMAFFLVLALIPVYRHLAAKIGLVDLPGGRKKHDNPVPLVGGVAIFSALAITILSLGTFENSIGLFLGCSGLFILGLIDDKFDLKATPRMLLQAIIIAIALYLDNTWLTHLGNFWGYQLKLGVAAYPLTVMAILGVINAINMLDGLDGLASGVLMIVLFFLLGLSSINNSHISNLITITLGAVVGFWLYNYRFPWRQRASVFMGDSGTTFLGFLLPYLAIHLTIHSENNITIEPAFLLWLFALPLWDITTVILKRLKDGKSPLIAGRDHIHHILLNHGLNVRQAVLFIYAITALSLSLGTSLLYFHFNSLGLYSSFLFAMYIYVERLFKYDKREMPDPTKIIDIATQRKPEIKSYITKV